MTDTFKNFKPLGDEFLLSEHKAFHDFAKAASAPVKPAQTPFVSPALMRMLASPQGNPSA